MKIDWNCCVLVLLLPKMRAGIDKMKIMSCNLSYSYCVYHIYYCLLLSFDCPHILHPIFYYRIISGFYLYCCIIVIFIVITFPMQPIFWFVPLFSTRCKGALVLDIWIEYFFFSLGEFISDWALMWSHFIANFSQILLIVRGLSSLSILTSRFSMIF